MMGCMQSTSILYNVYIGPAWGGEYRNSFSVDISREGGVHQLYGRSIIVIIQLEKHLQCD